MKRTYNFLLVDPHSVFHGPPEIIKVQDASISKLYSNALDLRIDKRLGGVSNANWNAVSTKYVTNYGLLMMGYFLKHIGDSVDYINGDYFENQELLYQFVLDKMNNYDVISMTATTPQFTEMKNLATLLKSNHYKGMIVFGGPHSYFFSNRYEETDFDLICVGHNLVSSIEKIHELLDDLEKNDRKTYKKTEIHHSSGYIDIEKDFSLIPRNRIKETLLYSYSSYGCPNSCKYCAEHYYNPQMCFPAFEKSFKEIEFLVNDVQVRSVHLADSDFFIFPKFSEGFIQELKKREIKTCFTVNTSPIVICKEKTIDYIKEFYKEGLIELLIGVEYFSEKVLKRMSKPYNIEVFMDKLSLIREACPDLLISFYSLLGLPGSDIESRKENYNWFKRIYEEGLFDFSFPKFFVPYPGTDVFEHPDEYNATILHMNWEKYHRWAIPRPISIAGLQDEDLLNEAMELYSIFE